MRLATERQITLWSRRGVIGLFALSVLLNLVFGLMLMSRSMQTSLSLLDSDVSVNASRQASSPYQSPLRTNHSELLKRINGRFGNLPSGSFSLYFETLISGGWAGIREDEKMSPGSLRKAPLIAAAFKLAEQGKLVFTRPVRIETRHLDLSLGLSRAVGPLAAKGSGQILSVKELVYYISKYSDNTATAALIEVVGYDAYAEAMFAMGMSWKTWRENYESNHMIEYQASAYEFTQVFRSLYYATYLRPVDSQEVLRLLTEADVVSGISQGVPGVQVAHKHGDWADGNFHHDCGIVYLPGNPYALCVMTKGLDASAARQLIAAISEEVAGYVRDISPAVAVPAR